MLFALRQRLMKDLRDGITRQTAAAATVVGVARAAMCGAICFIEVSAYLSSPESFSFLRALALSP